MSITQFFTGRHAVSAVRGRVFTGRSLVGDIESEYDEFDRDADLEVSKRREGWLEPSW
ncbi:hypothetical protein [Curtobacterium pusillum]|uniref:Uncharacterized protein n=1 Tax=Curtobacterium pusillum TaxID=69373 RepID=A0AAW3T1Z9_9MICO|nr:hypothetical protein [Curtobacterium pusillum]MBA8989441.1 hypothetical protein [Curtobacterium pusillum]NUU15050.1 hypothetical protein [Curtobacterium pusillum]